MKFGKISYYSRENPPNESSPFCPPSILLYLSRRNVVPPHFDEHNSESVASAAMAVCSNDKPSVAWKDRID
ncbi:hypothetical protein CK203_036537 [Vitis vinifera]|uniref:Uncharacterized protein n=1 Tax=Vitis vinifera TaxID=29760 RepID=A0A438HZV5_VITVI|nr:hypothetical protein CK203_036537 [Vitis vinifera]